TSVASGATSAAAGGATSAGSSQGFSMSQFLKDLFTDAGSDALRDRTKEVASIERRRRIASVVALAVTILLLAVFYTFAEIGSVTWASFAAALPIVGVAAVILALEKFASESLINRLSGARVRFRLWIAGVASMLVSTVGFHSPFGYPGYVDNGTEETKDEKRLAGQRALAILGITSAWGLVFVVAMHVGAYKLGSVGLAMAVTALATACMPFGPLPGGEVWRWNKGVSLLVAAAGFGVYVAYEMALIPEAALVAIGLAGATGYAVTAWRLAQKHGRRPPPRRVPVEDVDAQREVEKARKRKVEH